MKEFAAALLKAQGKIEAARKDSRNPHFKSTYADLSSVWDACRAALQDAGISVFQGGDRIGDEWVMRTTLLHTSGEYQTSYVPLLNGKGDMQGLGSAMTYARRYGLAAAVGVCPEDDDGNAASETLKNASLGKQLQQLQPLNVAPAGYADFVSHLRGQAKLGTSALKAAWLASPTDLRAHMTLTDSNGWDALKADAAAVTAREATV